MANPTQVPHGNPFIPYPPTQGILEGYTLEKALGILPIAKSDVFPTPFLWAQYSSYGFKFDTVQHWGIGEWYFPGHAVEAYTSCGEYSYQGCLNPSHEGQAFIRSIKHNCGRAGCPVCHKTWLVETTKKISHRINEAQRIFKEWGWRRTSPIHVTVSPPRSAWPQYRDIGKFNKLRQKAQQVAKKAGFHGGSIIFHPYRERCASCGGKIAFKSRKCEDCKGEDIVWYWSPHWHLFGFGWIRGTKALYQGTGYLVKNHGIRSDIEATAYYQLTHCGIHEGKHVLTWFGTLHYSKLHVEPYEPECVGPTECPLCGNRLRLLRYTGTKPPPIDEEGEVVGSTGWGYRYE